ncbi:hypothetical protein [uncultured Fibrobacter sp.]|uniref:hypothetical protein n=1 Tax=uncultured Fibrobacter sp. TaxID=261512 RepID=UPI0025D5A238|nr:hypothetical protein [uncultured Fibrobacter sp.]
MIATVTVHGSGGFDIYDENGNITGWIHGDPDTLVGYTSSTVSVKHASGGIDIFDETGHLIRWVNG